MRIQFRYHALDRAIDQLGVVRLVDVIGTYPLQHLVEAGKLTVTVWGRCRGLRTFRRPQDCHAASEHDRQQNRPKRIPGCLHRRTCLGEALFEFGVRQHESLLMQGATCRGSLPQFQGPPFSVRPVTGCPRALDEVGATSPPDLTVWSAYVSSG